MEKNLSVLEVFTEQYKKREKELEGAIYNTFYEVKAPIASMKGSLLLAKELIQETGSMHEELKYLESGEKSLEEISDDLLSVADSLKKPYTQQNNSRSEHSENSGKTLSEKVKFEELEEWLNNYKQINKELKEISGENAIQRFFKNYQILSELRDRLKKVTNTEYPGLAESWIYSLYTLKIHILSLFEIVRSGFYKKHEGVNCESINLETLTSKIIESLERDFREPVNTITTDFSACPEINLPPFSAEVLILILIDNPLTYGFEFKNKTHLSSKVIDGYIHITAKYGEKYSSESYLVDELQLNRPSEPLVCLERIAEEHAGEVEIKNEDENSTTINVTFRNNIFN